MASRLAPEPAKQTHHSDHSARPPKQEKKRSRALILIAVLCAVLLALYCALCAFGGSGDTLRDGTAVNGINIGVHDKGSGRLRSDGAAGRDHLCGGYGLLRH